MNCWSRHITAGALVLASMIAPSALIYGYSPVNGTVIFALGILLVFVTKKAWKKMNEKVFFLLLFIFLLADFSALYTEQLLMLLLPKYFILAVLVVPLLDRKDITAYVQCQTLLILIIGVGAVFGTLYAFSGGAPIFNFLNPDGRINELYLTTLTNFHIGNYIRPSGIYDEAGALSFVICFIAALRHILGLNKGMTWILLILGFITTSVAHLLYVCFHLLAELKTMRAVLITVICLILLIFLIMMNPSLVELFEIFSERFSNPDIGSDRLASLTNAFDYLDTRSFFFSMNTECAVGIVNCYDIGYKLTGENPLSMLIAWGALISFPYYAILIYLFVLAIYLRNPIIFGLLVLLLQRPYVMSFGYSLLILIPIAVLAQKNKFILPQKLSDSFSRQVGKND